MTNIIPPNQESVPVNTLGRPLKLVNITKTVLKPEKGVAAPHLRPL